MTKKWYLIISVIIVLIAALLRFYNFSARAPFDWDQNRDYLAVAKIASGNPTLVGPVAKGDGGFLLGPIYYYLVAPAFSITSSSPLSLPITSIILDLLAILAMLFMLRPILGDWATLLLSAIYSISFVAIEASRVSWNVALVPLYSVFLIYLLSSNNRVSGKTSLLSGLLAGLSWHIHAALIPLSLILLGIKFIISKPTCKYFLFIMLGYLVALSPLIIFDLRHVGLERHLILEFIKTHSLVKPSWSEVLVSVMSRYGKNIYGILTGHSDLQLAIGVVATMFALTIVFVKNTRVRLVAVAIVTNLALAILLREPGFPEYYLQFATISILFLVIFYIRKMLNFKSSLIILILYLIIQRGQYTFESTPFSLSNKLALTHQIASYNTPISLVTDLPYGRDFGFASLFSYAGIKQNDESKQVVLITENHDQTLFINGEIAQDIGYYGGFRLGIRGVQ